MSSYNWLHCLQFLGSCDGWRELLWGAFVFPPRSWRPQYSRLVWLELWVWGRRKFVSQNISCLPRWAQSSLTHWTWTSVCTLLACQPGQKLLDWNSLVKLWTPKTSLPTFTCKETQNLGWILNNYFCIHHIFLDKKSAFCCSFICLYVTEQTDCRIYYREFHF